MPPPPPPPAPRLRSRQPVSSKFKSIALAQPLPLLALAGCLSSLLLQPQHTRGQLIEMAPPPGPFDGLQLMSPSPPGPQFSQLLGAGKSSAASSLLANEFLALERERQAGSTGRAPRPAASSTSPSSSLNLSGPGQFIVPLHSATPVYSLALGGGGGGGGGGGAGAGAINGSSASFRLDEYHRLEEIYAFMEALARRYPRRVQVFTIGRTHEQRPIKALELKNNASDSDLIWLDSLTHAREWITATTLLYTLDRLVAGRFNQQPGDSLSAPIIMRKNYLIIPVVNPDGYAYTWSTNRMWRKNRSKSTKATTRTAPNCIGADLNRNFDHSFGGEGSSPDPCSHIYSGAYATSEPEIRAISELMWSLRDRIKFYLTMHSFNQLWACPYAHTTEQSAHLQTHMRVLRQIQQAVYQTEGVHYEIGPLSTSLYVGSGFGIDFAYDKCAIVHSYLVELRDRGARGFVLPADEIIPTARETFNGLRAGLRAVFGGGGTGTGG